VVFVAAPEDLLQQLSKDLRLLWTQAGGPSLRTLAVQVGLGKSQVSAIVNGRIRRPPDWEVVKNMIDSIRRYADDHGRQAELSLRTGVNEYWRPRYTVLEHAFRQPRRRAQAQDPVTPDRVADDPAAGAASAVRFPVPRQLPAAPAFFTGRTEELARLSMILDERADTSATVLVSAVGGMGGVGKTWLVLQWAHRHLARFPDGQLFADLRGFSPGEAARGPADVLRGFLLALGVEAARMPLELDDRVGLFRSLVADRRMLVILDNARDSEQVTPLLPGSSTCMVLVTSRNRLARLVTAHGAHALPVDVLTDADARELLAARLGGDRLVAEPDALATLVARCAGLPLALSIIAGRAQAHPFFPLAELAAGIDGTSTRLGVLDHGDPVVSLPAVLSWSYEALPVEQAQLFGLLGVAPGTDLSLPAAANLAGASLTHTAALLRGLEDVHLVQEHQPGRYRMHDLVKLYAADRANRGLNPADRSDGLRRLLDFLLHTAYTADPLLVPYRIHAVHIDPVPPVIPHILPDEASAWAWFDAEHPCLLAAQRLALEQGWYRHAWQLAWILRTFQYRRGLLHDLVVMWQIGVAAAQHEKDPAPLSVAHRWLGDAYTMTGRHADGMHHLNEALTLAQKANNPLIEALHHYGLAIGWARQGDDQQALECASTALCMFQGLDQPVPEAELHNTVGWLHTRLGHHDQAATHLQTALARFRQLHHLVGETNTLDSLGYLAHHTGHYHEALDYYHQALALYRQFNDSFYEADTLNRIGDTHAALGQHDEAEHARQQALQLYETQHRTQDINAPNSA
jgi:tetratricopeptide (TPR) repeat protein